MVDLSKISIIEEFFNPDSQETTIILERNPPFKKIHMLIVVLLHDKGIIDNCIILDDNRWCAYGELFDPHLKDTPAWLDEELKPYYKKIVELVFNTIFSFEKLVKNSKTPLRGNHTHDK